MIIESLRISGVEFRNVEVQERISDAAEYDTGATHIGFAKIDGDDVLVLSGTKQYDNEILWTVAL